MTGQGNETDAALPLRGQVFFPILPKVPLIREMKRDPRWG